MCWPIGKSSLHIYVCGGCRVANGGGDARYTFFSKRYNIVGEVV